MSKTKHTPGPLEQSAPELLEALKKMTAWVVGMSVTPPHLVAECDALVEQAAQAIDKAEGRELTTEVKA